jgi:predicted amidohydrolase YtcJ
MSQPFSDQREKSGFLVHSKEEIYRRMVMAHNAGLQIAIHTIGDAASKTCIDLYERLLEEHPKEDHRHRLEHASQLDASSIRDIARLGLVVSSQPLFIQSERHWLERRLGAERIRWTYPYRSLLDAGVRVAGASDAPIESLDVLDSIHCAVTREGFVPDQGVSAEEAIRMFTIEAAYAQFEENVKGSISEGKRADLVILTSNPASQPIEEIKNIRVEQTIRGGKTTFNRADR